MASNARKPQNKQKPVKKRKDGQPDRRQQNKLQPGMHEAQFRPGQSGNPGGRPKGIVRDALEKLLKKRVPKDGEKRQYVEAMCERVLATALQGGADGLRAFAEITDRVDGKAVQSVEASGPGGTPIQYANMSPEEVEARIAELLAIGQRKV